MCGGELRRAITAGIAHPLRMDDARRPPSLAAQTLASVAASRGTRLLVVAWWVAAWFMAALAYLDAIAADGLLAPAGGALFLAGACVVAAVARNASAEAHRPGSVRRGSLLRAAGFGAVVHGGLLAAVSVFAQSAPLTFALVAGGAILVVLSRPTTLTALGLDDVAVETDGSLAVPRRASRTPGPRELSVPQIVGELRASAQEVRLATDPARIEALAIRRGDLLDALAERDPETLMALLGESSTRPWATDGLDGPMPA